MTFRRNSFLPLVNAQMLFPGALLNSSQNLVINLWGCDDFPQDCRTGGWNIRMRGSPDPDIFPTASSILRRRRSAISAWLTRESFLSTPRLGLKWERDCLRCRLMNMKLRTTRAARDRGISRIR